MERIKREILQALTTGRTSGGIVIIPDTSVTYHFMVGLTQDTRDVGFMDVSSTSVQPEEIVYSTDGEGNLLVDNEGDNLIIN